MAFNVVRNSLTKLVYKPVIRCIERLPIQVHSIISAGGQEIQNICDELWSASSAGSAAEPTRATFTSDRNQNLVPAACARLTTSVELTSVTTFIALSKVPSAFGTTAKWITWVMAAKSTCCAGR